MTDHKALYEFATVRQIEYLEAIALHGSNQKAAAALNVNRRTIDQAMVTLKATAASRGHSPSHDMTRIVPPGFTVKGVSTYYNADGKPSGQWVKSSATAAAQESALVEFADSLANGVKGLAQPTPAPLHCRTELLCVYPIGDPHFGLRVWAQEGGGNFDLEEAERITCSAIDRLIMSAPNAQTAILLNLGDHFHADNQANTTTAGTVVDVDGRWSKIQQIGLRAMVYGIKRLLEKHEKVVFRINRGNHDKHASYALALMIDCYFHNEPRVVVDLSPAAVWYYQFGKVLIGSTHGDTIKGPAMMGVMATDKPELWGLTKHRMWLVGHIHHVDLKEYPGGTVEYFRTLAVGDAWHHGQGYRSGRDMRLIVVHKEYGEIERHRCDVGMLEAI
jgi:hypothetical protein